ncbi:MAG: methyltransferase domain-containing protein [Actinomycetales bacterium]|nr:methyltransferase domain-containing protein [Actinomycetales bacterium]
MAFLAADAYDSFMGRFSRHLAGPFADRAGVAAGQRALDVGCGPGALTAVLVERLGVEQVEAVDPAPAFVEAIGQRLPGVTVRLGTAEALPQEDDSVDVTMSQLVVHFMADPVAGLTQMARVTRPGGTVAACVWNLERGGDGPVSAFHTAVAEIDPEWAGGQEHRLGGTRGELGSLFRAAGMDRLTEDRLTVEVPMESFAAYWEPFRMGVGPAGDYVTGLSDPARADLEARVRSLLPDGPFTMSVSAWCVVAQV